MTPVAGMLFVVLTQLLHFIASSYAPDDRSSTRDMSVDNALSTGRGYCRFDVGRCHTIMSKCILPYSKHSAGLVRIVSSDVSSCLPSFLPSCCGVLLGGQRRWDGASSGRRLFFLLLIFTVLTVTCLLGARSSCRALRRDTSRTQ